MDLKKLFLTYKPCFVNNVGLMSIMFFSLYHTLDVQIKRSFSYRLKMVTKEKFHTIATFFYSILLKIT
jgi:hypothetical protein